MSTGKLYKVQIGAFHKKYYAQELANKAKNMGLEVYISEEEVTNTNKSNAKQTYDIGDKVNIKANARTYVTGEVIPNWVKKQTHTIQQMKGDRVLLEEIYSWVNKGDLK